MSTRIQRMGHRPVRGPPSQPGDVGALPAGGAHLDGGTDWGYRNTKPDWRKVILRSRYPMTADPAQESLLTEMVSTAQMLMEEHGLSSEGTVGGVSPEQRTARISGAASPCGYQLSRCWLI
jgi:hypothetical protein